MATSSGHVDDFVKREVAVIEEFKSWRESYFFWGKCYRCIYYCINIIAILCTGLTPAMVLWGTANRPIQVIPSVLAAILYGIDGQVLDSKSGWKRSHRAHTLLDLEMMKYKSETGQYSGLTRVVALKRLSQRIQKIVDEEQGNWLKPVGGTTAHVEPAK